MTDQPKRSRFATDSIAAPAAACGVPAHLARQPVSNLGLLIQGVGAAWAMTQMTSSADKVALVQTALMLPIMLISMPAGAIADMHDRRIVALVSLSIALVGATALTVLAWLGLVTPNILLALCFIVGSGMALFGPAWQASVSEQVPAETLPRRSRSTASATTSRAASARRSAASWSRPPARSRPSPSMRCSICR
jgi:MFS family permease